tara:strand:+ start:76 stop:288 length:213 start_codon:yes stop_codon:yes gene_type:complete
MTVAQRLAAHDRDAAINASRTRKPRLAPAVTTKEATLDALLTIVQRLDTMIELQVEIATELRAQGRRGKS